MTLQHQQPAPIGRARSGAGHRRPAVRRGGVAALAAVGLACGLVASPLVAGASRTGGHGRHAQHLTHITVLQQPVASWSPLVLAQMKGFYAKEGLAVTFKSATNASAALPLLLNGQAQFAGASPPVIIAAAAHGVGVTLVKGALMGNIPPNTRTWGGAAIVGAKGSTIHGWKGLVGKTVAVSGLDGFPQLGVILGLKKAGVNPSSVKFVDVPYPDMTAALTSGHVDAALSGQPFRQQQAHDGLPTVVTDPFTYAFGPNIPPAGTIAASAQYVKTHQSVVKRFVTALDEATAYLSKHPAAQAAAVGKYIPAPPAVLKTLHPEYYPPNPEKAWNVAALVQMAKDMKQFGWIPKVPPVSTWVMG